MVKKFQLIQNHPTTTGIILIWLFMVYSTIQSGHQIDGYLAKQTQNYVHVYPTKDVIKVLCAITVEAMFISLSLIFIKKLG